MEGNVYQINSQYGKELIDIIWEEEALYKKDVRCLDKTLCVSHSTGTLCASWMSLLLLE